MNIDGKRARLEVTSSSVFNPFRLREISSSAARVRYEQRSCGRLGADRAWHRPAGACRAARLLRVPGWYGKLPSLGDFASRRVEGDFIEPWDLWLGERLQALRDARGEAWLDAYLHSPPWRFLLGPASCRGFDPGKAVAGVLLRPSTGSGATSRSRSSPRWLGLPVAAHESRPCSRGCSASRTRRSMPCRTSGDIEALESALTGSHLPDVMPSIGRGSARVRRGASSPRHLRRGRLRSSCAAARSREMLR
jgi:hypothetical protein